MTRRAQSKRSLTLALLTIAGVVCILGSHQEPSGAQSNFVGGDPSRPDASDIRALRLRFELARDQIGIAIQLGKF